MNKDVLITISTPYGDMKAILYDETPLHKKNFIELSESGQFDSTIFHRVIENFMIQGGDVNLINDFSFKIKATNKIKHENLRLKFITHFIDRRYFKALIYILFLLFTNPYLTIKKISQQF